MANLNKVMLIGNLTRDPELRYTQGGMALVKFGLAVNRKYRNKNTQEMVEETTFVDVEGWGSSAETFNQYMAKGRPVYVEGRLKLDRWEGKDGQKQSKMMVVMENFQFLGSGGAPKEAGEPRGSRAPREGGKPDSQAEVQAGQVADRGPSQGEDYDFEDIPF